jgi:hypothetical protein
MLFYKKMIFIFYENIIIKQIHNMNLTSVTINLNKEKRVLYNNIKHYGIAKNGIIYGGMVRDEIIATHYRDVYDTYVRDNKISSAYQNRYWDSTFHEESNKRLIIPNDMDIYFDNNENAELFIESIKAYSGQFSGGSVYIRDITRTNVALYLIGHNFSHKKVKMIFKLGRTIVFNGIRIEINIDMIINNSENRNNIEPPFNCADFSSNLFVMVKNYSGRYDIRLSKNTGTKLDDMNYVSKKRIEMDIINNLINGKTEFIRRSYDSIGEYINGMRILKMISREYPLSITNILFKDVENIDEIKVDQDCDICQSSVKSDYGKDGKIIEINTNKCSKNYMHRCCFIQYLEKEINSRRFNELSNSVECRCTRRNLFNFKESHKYSSLY